MQSTTWRSLRSEPIAHLGDSTRGADHELQTHGAVHAAIAIHPVAVATRKQREARFDHVVDRVRRQDPGGVSDRSARRVRRPPPLYASCSRCGLTLGFGGGSTRRKTKVQRAVLGFSRSPKRISLTRWLRQLSTRGSLSVEKFPVNAVHLAGVVELQAKRTAPLKFGLAEETTSQIGFVTA